MSCPSLGIVGRIFSTSTPEMVQGADFRLVTEIRQKEQNGTLCQAGFSNFTGATAFFKDANDEAVAFVGALSGSQDLGRIAFAMAATGTALVAAGTPVPFEQHFTDDNGLTILQFADVLNVAEQLF